MRSRLLIPALFLSFFSGKAQNDLSGSQRQSPFVYAWSISDTEALYLYSHNMKDWEKNNLHTLADSFPSVQTTDPPLPPGNYLFVQARGAYLSVTLRTMGPLRYDLLNNGRSVSLLLHTAAGAPIRDAEVHVRRREAPYDPGSGSYPLGRWKKSRPVKVVYQHALYFFPVIHTGPSRRPVPHYRYDRYGYNRNAPYEEKFRSFMVFSKPNYKPADTVQGKAFLMDKNGRPVDRPLVLRVSDHNRNTDTIIADLRPYRPGGYTFSFVLDDSLDLSLDRDYQVTLEETGSRRKSKKEEDEEDEDKVVARRKVLSRGTFKYEEYDLKSIRFHARADRTEHGPGEPVSVFLQASDENDLPVADGRVSIEVRSSRNAERFLADAVFVPDTLWTWSQPLDPVGETRVILPDSIFPSASFPYTIRCSLLNSNNELHEEQLYQHYLGDTGRIFFHQHSDSLDIDYRIRGRLRATPATVYQLTQNGETVGTRSLSLPASLAINAYASRYVVRVKGDVVGVKGGVVGLKGAADSLSGSYRVNETPPLSFEQDRTRDSIHILVRNPWGIHFWYALSVDGSNFREGYTDQLDYRDRTASGKPYGLRLQYIWEGKVRRQDHTAPFQEKLLQLQIKEPAFVYPGQKTNISIGVRDADGKPVPDADLTAWSTTSKFTGFQYPPVPYLGKRYRYKQFYDYNKGSQSGPPALSPPLDWRRWGRDMGLDTIEYYKFLNPATVYVNREPVAEKITQLAPFVSRKGQLQPVELLYIDEQLVFFSQTQQVLRYSFPVDSGRHSLRIRLRDKEIRLDSLWAQAGMKNFICINDDTANKAIRSIRRPDTLTGTEKTLLNSSMLLLENSFGDSYAAISQGPGRSYLFNAPGSPMGSYGFLAGPLTGQGAELRVEDSFVQSFEPEGGYRFNIQPGLIRQKQWPAWYLFHSLTSTVAEHDLRDRPLTRAAIDSLWQDYADERSATRDLYQNEPNYSSAAARLVIGGIKDTGGRETFVKKIFLFRYNDPDFMRIYKGIDRDLGYVAPGNYRVLLLLKKGRYLLRDSVFVKANGLNYYGFGSLPVRAADSFSLRIDGMLRVMERQPATPGSPEARTIQLAMNDRNADLFDLRNPVSGRVTGEEGKPIQGVVVTLKGTHRSTATDQNGYFRMGVSDKGTLIFAYIGYASQEMSVQQQGYYEVKLAVSMVSLSDVVVVGYSAQKKRNVTGAVISIRGLAGDMKDTVSIPSLGSPMTGSKLRRHFRDNAFWQPQLRTDANGIASFSVRYPDDITSWVTCAVAVTADRQTGMTQGYVRAFRPLSVNLGLPAFLVTGDETRVIGKVLNYTPDTVTVERTFHINGKLVADNWLNVRNAHIDSFSVHPETTDSLLLSYSLTNGSGYSDAEERPIPVFPAGVKETRGHFAALEGDTGVRWSFDTALGPVHVFASASLLPVLLDEIENLRTYEYLCNEQSASKLMALLQKKRIYRLLRKDFEEEKNITELISRLLKARRGGALWGWWPEAAPSAWVSLHVTQALLMAEKEGYTVQLDKQAITDYLINSIENDPVTRDGLFRVRLLQLLGARVNYSKYIDSLDKKLKFKTLFQTLQLQELKQAAGLPIRLDTLVAKRQYTVLGNCYWGEDSLAFFDNAIQNTVLLYRLLRRAGGYGDLLKKVRDYLLEKRGSGFWRNTYESSLILETLLPDLLEGGQVPAPPALSVNGKNIPAFPYRAELPAGQAIEVRQSGKLPVYFTAYQQFINKAPEKVTGTFAVRSWWEKEGVLLSRLKAGVPATLQVEVEVKGDADYVLIEIPIPGGCMYRNKEQSYGYQEAHREYFKNKLSIFSSYLGKGRHRFSVELLPRYTGAYHLNPAKAEMMYFPVLYGREGMKTVEIE